MRGQTRSEGSATPRVLGTDRVGYGGKVGWKALGVALAAALVLGGLPLTPGVGLAQEHGVSVGAPLAQLGAPAGASASATTCSDDLTSATIFGRATVDGSGAFIFRIDLIDQGQPGTNDAYGIIMSDGYASGQKLLRGGNVTIHKS